MKQKVKITQEIEVDVKAIVVQLPVRYGEDQIPNNFPLRIGDTWTSRIDIDTGKIENWPNSFHGRLLLELKVCDEGVYTLLDSNDKEIARLVNDYVPHRIIPGRWGDIVYIEIGPDGVIQNWPKQPDVSEFFGRLI